MLNYLVKRELAKKVGKVVPTFAYLKAAFDTINRLILWETM